MNSMTNLPAERKVELLARADEVMQTLLSICEDETLDLSVEECEFFYRAIADGFNDEVGE